MSTGTVSMDDVRFNKFHWKVFAVCVGCPFIDGYALGIIAVGLAEMHRNVEVSAFWGAMIGMGTLLGMFLGALIGGPITDAIGRRKMFMLDFSFIVIVCVLGFFFVDPMMVFIFRVLLGIGLGADYPIAGPYLTEFSPKKQRGGVVGALNAFWYIGYAAAFVIGYSMLSLGEDAWRWMLASPAVIAFVWLIGRLVMPESPRWLMRQGRHAEAAKVLKKIGPNVVLGEDQEEEKMGKFADIFKNGYGKWVFFVGAFWSLQVMPTFGIGTYVPTILANLGFADGSQEYLGAALMNVFYLLGLIPIYFLMDRLGRRPTMLWPFLVSGIALIVLAATSGMQMSFAFVLTMFVIYGAFNVVMGAHQWVYPNELFPTQIRATAVGFVVSVSRIASAAATFFFPYVMNNWGLSTALYICAGMFLVGFVLTYIMAPETKDMNLADAAEMTATANK
ncbi:MAG: MFS transporter [Tessaracoccus sp.]